MSKRNYPPSVQMMSFDPRPTQTYVGTRTIWEVSLRRWPVTVRGLGVPERKRFSSESEADRYCQGLRLDWHDHVNGRRTYHGPKDLETLGNLYVRALRADNRAIRTLLATSNRLGRFAEVLAATDAAVTDDLGQVSPWHLQAFKTALREEPYSYGINHLHNTMATVHGFLSWCVHPQGVMEKNPAAGLVPPRDAPKRLALSPTQRRLLRDHAAPERWRVYELVMLTGLRRGELRPRLRHGEVLSGSALTVHSVVQGLRGWFIRVSNKGKSRDVALEGRSLELIRELVAEANLSGRDELIPVTYNTLGDWWKWDRGRVQRALLEERQQEQAGAWSQLTFHSLRATAITTMVNDLRLPLGDVASIVGHEDIRTTENYRQPDEAMVRRSLATLGDVLLVEDFPESSGTFAVSVREQDA